MHISSQGKLKRLNAAIEESFRTTKKPIVTESSIEENSKGLIAGSSKDTSSGELDLKDLKNRVNEFLENNHGEESVDSSENKIVSNAAEPIIITSTSISISLEENPIPFVSTTLKPKIESSSSGLTTSTLKPKITKGRSI